MSSRTILINARESLLGAEIRVVIAEEGHVVDFDLSNHASKTTKGNIYLGTVLTVEPSLEAAFVNYGTTRHGFLPFSDVTPAAYCEGAPSNPGAITDVLKRKQPVIVQVLKEEIGTKGAALTTAISLPGRYLVLVPGSDLQGISRKIENEEERQRIKQITQSLPIPQGMGVIVRTAGLEQNKTVLLRDLKYLLKLWQQIEKRAQQVKSPCLLSEEHNLVLRTLRDYLTPDVTRIVVDDEAVFEEAREFLKLFAPRQVKALEMYQESRPLFNAFMVESQVEALFGRRVQLKSGGSLVIEQTEALVSIDVNSGRMTQELSHEETAYRTNVEAAKEIARQLRLRDLGGIIVIDFIDMSKEQRRRDVEKILRDEMQQDKARIRFGHISAFGLLELTRQRLRPALRFSSMEICTQCNGSGYMRSSSSEAMRLLRSLHERLATQTRAGEHYQVTLAVLPYVLMTLLNDKRKELAKLEETYHCAISVVARTDLGEPYFAITLERIEKERTQANPSNKNQSKSAGAQGKNGAPVSRKSLQSDELDEGLSEDLTAETSASDEESFASAEPQPTEKSANGASEAQAPQASATEAAPRPKRRRRGGRRRNKSAQSAADHSTAAPEVLSDIKNP